MCLQDYAIGMGLFVSEKAFTATVAQASLVGANPNRTFLAISHPDANTIWLTTLKDAGVGIGIHLGSGDQTVFLDVQRHGNLPSKAWNVIAAGGNASFSVFEGEFDLERAREFMRKIGAYK